MTKYYFISYIGTKAGLVFGCCTAKGENESIDVVDAIGREIQKINGFEKPAMIISMKDLTKKELEMQRGGNDGRS